MTPDNRVELPASVVDAAVAWSVRLHYTGAAQEHEHAFAQWLLADTRHALAWERIAAVRGAFGGLPAPALRRTLDTAGRRTGRRNALKLLGVAGTGVAAAWLAHRHAPWQQGLADAATGIGERRNLQLADGTALVLNTDTAVIIDARESQSAIRLLRGEVLVTSAQAASARGAVPARAGPVRVRTPMGELQAHGTRFAVRLRATAARVSVEEGSVSLHPLARGGAPAGQAAAGEHWSLTRDGAARIPVPAMDPYAWVDGAIAGRDMRLADFLAELARYREGRIVCDDRVADLRLSGVYFVRDTEQVLRLVAQTQPVRVRYATRYWVRVGPATQGA